MARRIPMVDYLVLDEEGPTLVAHECVFCEALYFERRNACAHCGADVFTPRKLARTGVVTSFTIVHRSAPGVQVPFFSVVVALDGGGSVKATLRDIDVDPDLITPHFPVELTTFVAGVDSEGDQAVAFAFRPRFGCGTDDEAPSTEGVMTSA